MSPETKKNRLRFEMAMSAGFKHFHGTEVMNPVVLEISLKETVFYDGFHAAIRLEEWKEEQR